MPKSPPIGAIFSLKKLAEEFGYHPKSIMRLEREQKIPPLLRRGPHCRAFGTDEHREALAGRGLKGLGLSPRGGAK